MKRKLVTIEPIKTPIRRSPGFEKKDLSTHALDIMGLCEYGCRYCSSNAGNYLRINREKFADATEAQLGERLYPSQDPALTFQWEGVVERIEEQLRTKAKNYGEGKTLVFSMLTDGFSPGNVASGMTRRVLDLVVERTKFRIRVLTKNACVGSKEWVRYFVERKDRFVVGLSTGTLDDAWAKRVEIGTSPPSKRIVALQRLQDAGVPTYGMLCPIFPAVMSGAGGFTDLVDAIRPLRCETVWSEPYNDRDNWQHVQAGHDKGSPEWRAMERIFTNKVEWSSYAMDLGARIYAKALREGWLSKSIYLLYEDDMTYEHAKALVGLAGMRGISLQSAKGDDGLSRHPAFRVAQQAEAQRMMVLDHG